MGTKIKTNNYYFLISILYNVYLLLSTDSFASLVSLGTLPAAQVGLGEQWADKPIITNNKVTVEIKNLIITSIGF